MITELRAIASAFIKEPIPDSVSFKDKFTFNERYTESQNIIMKYPDRIPIICEQSSKTNKIVYSIAEKKKYLVPPDLTISQFMFVLRKRIKLNAEIGIYIFVKGTIPKASATLGQLYNSYKDDDGFLYFTYSQEATFGA